MGMARAERVAAGLSTLVAGALLAMGPALAAQEAGAPPADPWGVLRQLVGSWDGQIDGKLGTGRGVRRYELIMGGRYLVCHHRSVRLPQEKSPTGDEHEELGVFSFDRERKTIVYREFLNEGVVVRSACEVEARKVSCVSEAVENGTGTRARLTLEFNDRYHFTETYDLGFPNREIEHYFTNHWTRTPVSHDWD
jgi:hypothetical protein